MDKNRIIQIIDWALQQSIRPYEPSQQMNPNSFHIKNLMQSSIIGESAVIDQVTKVLREEKQLNQIFDTVMYVPGFGLPLKPQAIVEWLLARALAYHSSEIAANLLQKFVDGRNPPTLEVFALCGFGVQAEIALPHNISLIPFLSLPQSEMSDFFQRRPSWCSRDWNFRRIPEPTSALILKDQNGIVISSDISSQPKIHDEVFRKVALCLTLFGPSAPTPIARWCQIEDWSQIPLGGAIGSGVLYLDEILPEQVFPILDTTMHDVYDITKRYLELDKATYQRITLPLQRLNLAVKRQSKVDQAIELRIALESLLIGKNTEHISAKIRERGSQLIGTDPINREEIKQT